MTRVLALLAAISATAWAQFQSLATTYDGSAVYFTTTLRLKNAYESPWGKVFAADERGVRLVADREQRLPPGFANYRGNCVAGALDSFLTVELSADASVMAAAGYRRAAGECHYPSTATLLSSPTGSRDVTGALRLSANGRYAIVDTTTSFNSYSAAFVDLATGERVSMTFPAPNGYSLPAAGRAVADDGTAVLTTIGVVYMTRRGAAREALVNGFALAISATGGRVLYSDGALHVLEIDTRKDWLLTDALPPFTAAGLSDDGSRAAFLRRQQLYVVDVGGSARQVSGEADGLTSAILSGNGKVAYAVTGSGRLVKILVDSGDTTEIVGRTPYIVTTGVIVDAGFFANLTGHAFSDESAQASPPLPLTLGGVTVTVDGRAVPLSRVTPDAVDALIPWDMAGSAPRAVVVYSSAARTPFDAPQGNLQVMGGVRAGARCGQGWSPLGDGTVYTGEIIHVYAVGLGPVTPEAPPGSLAPTAEPLARLASPMSCTNAEALFAGLQPGALTRSYQVDLRIGSKTGYQVFSCQIGAGSSPAPFLTLNVVP